MAPTEPQQVIAQRLGQIAHVAIGLDTQRAMPLRELGAVRAVDQRDMSEFRDRPVERAVDLYLAESVTEMLVAADDMGDAHVMVVDDDREIIGWRAIRAQDDE